MQFYQQYLKFQAKNIHMKLKKYINNLKFLRTQLFKEHIDYYMVQKYNDLRV